MTPAWTQGSTDVSGSQLFIMVHPSIKDQSSANDKAVIRAIFVSVIRSLIPVPIEHRSEHRGNAWIRTQ